MQTIQKPAAQWPIWLYIPNLLGYLRIILLFIIAYNAFTHPIVTASLYFSFAMIDTIDGTIATWLQQRSKLGGMVDLVVDRVGIAVLSVVLAMLFPSLWGIFLVVIVLDMASHYCHMFVAMYRGSSTHKSAKIKPGSLLAKYYDQKKRGLMLYCCFSHDMFLAMFYWYYFYPKTIVIAFGVIFLPGFLLKTWIHIAQIINAVSELQSE